MIGMIVGNVISVYLRIPAFDWGRPIECNADKWVFKYGKEAKVWCVCVCVCDCGWLVMTNCVYSNICFLVTLIFPMFKRQTSDCSILYMNLSSRHVVICIIVFMHTNLSLPRRQTFWDQINPAQLPCANAVTNTTVRDPLRRRVAHSERYK